jgi:hypothetical protein
VVYPGGRRCFVAQIAYKVVVDNPSLRPGTVIEYRSAEGMESTEGYLLKEEAEWSAFLEENMQAQAQWAAEKAQAERAAKEAARMEALEALRATLIAEGGPVPVPLEAPPEPPGEPPTRPMR